jgi:hypothetical protein
MPIGAASNPKPAAQSVKFGGTHKRDSWPSARTAAASATAGRTSPSVPTEEINIRMDFSLPSRAAIT